MTYDVILPKRVMKPKGSWIPTDLTLLAWWMPTQGAGGSLVIIVRKTSTPGLPPFYFRRLPPAPCCYLHNSRKWVTPRCVCVYLLTYAPHCDSALFSGIANRHSHAYNACPRAMDDKYARGVCASRRRRACAGERVWNLSVGPSRNGVKVYF